MLSKKHIRILNRIKKNKDVRTEKQNQDLEYLLQLRLIEICQCNKPDDCYVQPYLTEFGKAVLDNEVGKQRKYLITTAIAMFAAISAYRDEIHLLLQALMQLLK